MFAASGGDADMIHLLLGKGAAIDAQSKDGKTALHWAVVAHKLAAVDALVASGAALDVRQVFSLDASPSEAWPLQIHTSFPPRRTRRMSLSGRARTSSARRHKSWLQGPTSATR